MTTRHCPTCGKYMLFWQSDKGHYCPECEWRNDEILAKNKGTDRPGTDPDGLVSNN